MFMFIEVMAKESFNFFSPIVLKEDRIIVDIIVSLSTCNNFRNISESEYEENI